MGSFCLCVLTFGVVFGLTEPIQARIHSSEDFQRHIINFAPKTGKSPANGCQIKPVETIPLLGTARACPAKKPIKLTKGLKMGKQLCAKDWQICAITDKAVQKLSWKKVKMPQGCFAFNYGKNKAAGYGNKCHANHYFDGVLCCPTPGTKIAHHVYSSPSDYIHGKIADHRLNLIE